MRIFYLLLFAWICSTAGAFGQETLPDSIITIEHTYLYCLSDPAKAQQIMDELLQRKHDKEWELDWCQADLYYNTGKYKLASYFFELAKEHEEVKQSPRLTMGILSTMMECYRMNNNDDTAMKYAGELLKLAKTLGDDAETGRAYLFMGQLMERRKEPKQAGEFFALAEKHLKQSGDHYYLFHFYLTCANLLQEDEQHEAALEKLHKAGEALALVEADGMPEGYIEFQQGLNDALAADILARCGKKEEAEAVYRRFMQSPYAHDDRGKIHIVPYLLTTNRNRQAIDIAQARIETLRNETDTVGDDMLAAKRYMATAYKQEGEIRHALDYAEQVADLLKQLRESDQKEAAAELATLYGVQEKERVLAEQQSSLKLRESMLWAASVILILTLGATGVIAYQLRENKRKNRAMVKQMEAARLWRERLEAQQQVETYEKEEEEIKPKKEPRTEKEVFNLLETVMKSKKLYLNPHLTRDEVIRMLGVKKLLFIKAIKEYSGGSFIDYINELRMNRVLTLFEEADEKSYHEIAEHSGFGSTRTLYRVFRDRYGMSPGEYRKEKESMKEPKADDANGKPEGKEDG